MQVNEFPILHLVTLSGGGDTYHKLVGPATFEYICSQWGGKTGQSSYEENIPEEVKKEFIILDPSWKDKSSFNITIGSYDNDRAIQVIGKDFDSASQACKWAFKEGIELGDDYEGCVY